ncbi:MAG: dimethyladenosine transferase [Acidimicrobiales bacterium]|nr:SRPBCC family protein [Acidimicrobiaceae bacterium]MXV86371.1 dimethyladenosine transferase [Acidimicrobiales bacterium]MCY3609055.1 SRPBCC family protein [Acidimicrobiaceae bacterium]MCY3892272.1 SRPBCC family protein [Acidimicrobiaceae bacterium]MDE0677805.1 SRPBCC family protein [Acidimicrobiaceae bacterium]
MAKPTQRSVSVERLIAAPAEKIFAVLTDPRRHCEIDGSGTLARLTTSNAPLTLGSTFSMRIKVGVSYTVKNRVLEFEENRLITWAHWQGQRWSYQLEPQPGGATLVRETFDWSTAKLPRSVELIGAHRKNVPNMEKTLERLAALVEAPADGD